MTEFFGSWNKGGEEVEETVETVETITRTTRRVQSPSRFLHPRFAGKIFSPRYLCSSVYFGLQQFDVTGDVIGADIKQNEAR
ncbi:unnamed protein product [Pieris brassicae]|uniref:Uncharacterized protein n=1 Tax=Pieris brassicae TaxID=7116 RepID=A0A9P0XI20_PIEBR|nr:unnamed protein product [Pieris brassicae]